MINSGDTTMRQALSQHNDEILIKKYPNRRLYDTSKSEYVTMDVIANMVREDIKIKVIDAKTEEDLTRVTLTQIILDQESKGYNLIPMELLVQIVKFCNHPMSKMYSEYLLTSINAFENNMGTFNNVFDGSQHTKQFMKMSEDNMKVFNDLMQTFVKTPDDKK